MTEWYHLRHQESGEEQTVASAGGWPGGYPKGTWKLVARHDREKTAHDDVVDGNLVHNAERKAREERHSQFATWSPGEIVDHFDEHLGRIERRLETLEEKGKQ